jgi:DNA-binding CsgD family transcriptional regulator
MTDDPVRLAGRAAERAALRRLLDHARAGISSAVVVLGEPGIGKTALISELAQAATGFTVTRVQGLEPETQLPYAALHRLLVPFNGQRPALPAEQRTALDTIFGLSHGAAPSPFLVGLASLTLFAEAAAHTPVLCVVDDVHLVDRASLRVVRFLVQRLLADRVVVVCSAPAPAELHRAGLDAWSWLRVGRLGEPDALAVIAAVAPETDKLAARRILTAAQGNPLALTELARQLRLCRTDGLWRPDPLPLSRPLEKHFSAAAARLAAPAQLFLVLAAADSSGDLNLLWDAASRLGIDRAAVPDGELSNFLTPGEQAVFRHPLVRSAIYGAASPADLARVHGALAQVTDPVRDPDRRAWHRAAAAAAPDEGIAAELERVAGRPRNSGGPAAETTLLARSAELTPDPRVRAIRLVAAAAAAVRAGDLCRVPAMLDRAEPALAGPVDRARVHRIQAMVPGAIERTADVPAMLSQAARTLEQADVRLARDTWFQALHAVTMAGPRGRGVTAVQVASAALEAPPPPPGAITLRDLLLQAHATRIVHGHARAVPLLRQALSAPSGSIGVSLAIGGEPLGLSLAALELWDFSNGGRLLTDMAGDARRHGALPQLWQAHLALTHEHAWAGELDAARTSYAAAAQAAEIVGQDLSWAFAEHVRILCDPDEDALKAISVRSAGPARAGLAFAPMLGHVMLALGWASRSRYDDALMSARIVFDHDPPGLGSNILPDLVEAAVRSGDHDTAVAAFGRLTERAGAAGSPWAKGLLARCAALLGPEDDAGASFAAAARHLAAAGMPLDQARTHLLHGEWLRRRYRRTDALDQLRRAHEMFTTMGATAFAERARAEIGAASARPRSHVAGRLPSLTPQEEQVARMATRGATNREIAAALYLSEATVAYHLQKAYRKFGITSRRQLVPLLASR